MRETVSTNKEISREKCEQLDWDVEMLALQPCECEVSMHPKILSSGQEPPGKPEIKKRL